MEEKITPVFCLCDDLLKALGIKEDPQVKMTNAEVMTLAEKELQTRGCLLD